MWPNDYHKVVQGNEDRCDDVELVVVDVIARLRIGNGATRDFVARKVLIAGLTNVRINFFKLEGLCPIEPPSCSSKIIDTCTSLTLTTLPGAMLHIPSCLGQVGAKLATLRNSFSSFGLYSC